MSKKLNKLVLLSALMIAIIGTFGTVSAEEFDLIADGGNVETAFPVGVVEVTNDADNLYVTFSITEGDWEMTETHLDVKTDESLIPQTNKGNPKVGKFDYSNSTVHTVHEYTIPIPDGCGVDDDVTIAAHAAVQLFDGVVEGEKVYRYESAWGEGVEFNDDRNWAMYFTYTIA
ncbi:MAG: hypothetical protein K8R06_03245 [Methanosarcinales archaeon]|nr:hypothetical protein [Methanosarcinales archaeon]